MNTTKKNQREKATEVSPQSKNRQARKARRRQAAMASLVSQPVLPMARFSNQAIQSLKVPQAEQERLTQFLSTHAGNQQVLDYLTTLVSPRSKMCRVPDSFARPTALVRSIATYDILCRLDTTVNSGRFAVAVRPTLGDTDNNNPAGWKIAATNSGIAWPIDFTSNASFVNIASGTDLRVDPFFTTLTQPPLGLLSGLAVTPSSTTPFSAGTSSFTVNTAASFGLGFSIEATTGRWHLPPGTYMIDFETVNTAAVGITATASSPGNLGNLGTAGNNIVNAHITYIWVVDQTTDYVVFTLSNNTCTVIQISITPTISALGGTPSDFGTVSQIRPVAMSALASYIGTTLQDGGNIAAAYVPGQSLEQSFFVNSASNTTLGAFEFWEALSKVPNSYNGPIRDGAYVWWSPEDYEDLQMVRPSGIPGHTYPSIVISGQFNPGPVTVTSASPVIRLEVVTVYEFVTNSLLFESSACMGTQAMMDAASSALFGQKHAMPNAIHLKWLSDLAKSIGSGIGSGARYIGRNADKILPILGTVGSLL